jgi:Lar family restriction alleviation protein
MKLKPCPFCGSTASTAADSSDFDFAVFCDADGCGAAGPSRSTPTQANEAWNARATVAATSKRKAAQ